LGELQNNGDTTFYLLPVATSESLKKGDILDVPATAASNSTYPPGAFKPIRRSFSRDSHPASAKLHATRTITHSQASALFCVEEFKHEKHRVLNGKATQCQT
jgi:hypothetical protein